VKKLMQSQGKTGDAGYFGGEKPMRTSLFVLCLFLSGCATGRYAWTHPTFTEQTYKRDNYECERDMRQSAHFGRGLVGELNAYAFNARCMEARGYTWVKVQ
jgi:hypothetical protein